MKPKEQERPLRFKQIVDYKLIPQDLILQLEGAEWTVEKFSLIQEALKNDPNNLLFGLVEAKDKKDKLVGFCWAQCDELKKAIFIHGLSIDVKYQDGNILPFTKRFFDYLIRKSNGMLEQVYWITERAKAYEKYGFFKSKYCLMCLYKEA